MAPTASFKYVLAPSYNHTLPCSFETPYPEPPTRDPLPAAALINHFLILPLRNPTFLPILTSLQEFHSELETLTSEYQILYSDRSSIQTRPLEEQREYQRRLSAFAGQTARKEDLQKRLDGYWRSTEELKKHIQEYPLDDVAMEDFDDVAQLRRWWRHMNNYHRRFWRGAVVRLVRECEGEQGFGGV